MGSFGPFSQFIVQKIHDFFILGWYSLFIVYNLQDLQVERMKRMEKARKQRLSKAIEVSYKKV